MATVNSIENPTTAAARAELERFEAETQSLTPEQVGIELGRHDWQVAQTMSEPDETGYLVRKEWTLKGLRCHLASEQYLETLLPPEDTGSATDPANRPSDPAATHAHLQKGERYMLDLKSLLRTLRRSAQKQIMDPGDAGTFCDDVLTLAEMVDKIAENVADEIDRAGLALYYRPEVSEAFEAWRAS